ncbi:gypsy/ty3 retroelement polyprotein [Tanacetum coccineum]
MVNTRNNNLITNTPTPTDLIQAALGAIQETLVNIQAKVRTHTTDIANLKRGEGTSQPRTDELTGQPRTHPEPNTPYKKLIKIEFPKFSGGDVKDWVYRCKQFFKVDGVADGRKVQLASMHMFDATLVWYQQYVKKYPDNTPWEHFEVEVVKRFGVLYDDPIVELKNLKQTGSVQTYQEVFEALLNKVDLPELVAVSMFIGGLKPEVGTPMRMLQATTLSESYGLARMQEATNTILKPRLAKTIPMQVSVANGQRMMSTSVYHDLKWSLQNEVFTSDVMLLPLGGCEIVLGIQWLATLRDMQCNERMLKQAELSSMALCVYPVQLCQMKSVGSVSAEVEQVLT